MNIGHIFTAEYLFGYAYAGLGFSGKVYFALALMALALGLICWGAFKKSKNPVQKDFYRRSRNFGLTIGLLGLVWSLLRYERIVTLSNNIVIIVIYVIGLFWLAKLVRYWLGDYKLKYDQYEKEQSKNKYL